MGYEKLRFRQISRFISETTQDSYNEILVGTYALLNGEISNDRK